MNIANCCYLCQQLAFNKEGYPIGKPVYTVEVSEGKPKIINLAIGVPFKFAHLECLEAA